MRHVSFTVVMKRICSRKTCTREAAPDHKCCKGCLATQAKYDRKNDKTFERKLDKKINKCKYLDRKKGYKIAELVGYLKAIDITDMWNTSKICHYCKVLMQYENCQLPNGMTIERLKNPKPHLKDNCVLACHRCNCRHNNKLV